MTIHLITFASLLHKNASVEKSHESILIELEKYFTVRIIEHTEAHTLSTDDFKLVFIATGGVEKMVVQNFESLPRPTVILADGMQNSLAAALEVSAFLRTRDMKPEIMHGEAFSIVKRITELYNNFEAQKVLRKKRIGVMGISSSWLVASNVDYLLAKRRWGIEFIDIKLDDVYDRFDQVTDDEIGEEAARIAQQALACREATPEDLLKAMRLYKAIKELCIKKKLDAFTINCFKLIEARGTTGCLALSLLNDDGILAGCEGDLQSIFTMLAAKAVTGQTGFMTNPAFISTRDNDLVLAHCTVGLKQVDQYIIRNHFETETGVSIQGIFPTGEVTVIKCSGECLDEYYVSAGWLEENTNFINACRTQVRVKLDSPVDYFLRNPLGNHHILIRGNHEKALNEFFMANGCKKVE
ncbi:MAG: fucose isomerase [Bacteroides sp.]|nr:fucose isomerase [Bacteroides sp.]